MRARVLLPLLLALYGCGAFAAPSTVFLEELTWTEVRDEIRAGRTTIIVPVGGTEQNGPAIALGKHNARVGLLSARIALALGNALVAPVIAYVPEGALSPPSGHMRFAGTITVPDATFDQVIEYAARSFGAHGFRHIVLLGDHGGYQKNLQAVADRLNRQWAATPVRVLAVPEYYRAAQADFAQALRQRGFRDEEIGGHAGLADTALTLALAPQLVRVDRLQQPVGAPDGVHGDPRRATAELGQVGVETIITRTVDAIRKATAPH
ncbi:MAG TPA: creatininase family protein [Burkholderiaceae bacterium]|nr:creatininase family protein [Burkholderiaceae bacterium]